MSKSVQKTTRKIVHTKKNTSSRKKGNLRSWWEKIRHQIVLLLTILACSFLLLPEIKSPHNQLKLGNISPEDFKSPAELSVEDEVTTRKRKAEAVSAVIAVYDFDLRVENDLLENVNIFFKRKREFFQKLYPDKNLPNTEASVAPVDRNSAKELVDVHKRFIAFIKIPVEKEYFRDLEYPIFDKKVSQSIKMLIKKTIKQGIVGSKELLQKEKTKGITTLNIISKAERHIRDITSIADIKEAKEGIRRRSEKIEADLQTQKLMAHLAGLFIQPNLTFNNALTEERKKLAAKNAAPVYFQLKKGEMIVREGEKLRADHLVKLEALEKLRKKTNVFLVLCGLVLLVSFLTRLLYIYIGKSKSGVTSSENKIILIEVLIAFSLLISKYSITVGNALASYFSGISVLSFHYAVPFNIAPIMVVLLLDLNMGIWVVMIVSLLAGILMGNLTFSVITFIGGVGSILFLAERNKRISIALSGLIMGAINSLIVLAMSMVKGHTVSLELLNHMGACMIGGLFTVSLASMFLPIAESVFSMTTYIKLLELSNFNQPLLRSLAMDAPGTYYHSIILGNLAEAACQAINANYLLARVSSYYHDIGKIPKAGYFIENSDKACEKHRKLTPRMSRLVLVSHVKDGVELAKKSKLSASIIDIIKQHHGTSLMRFFYQKAKDSEVPGLDCVNVEDYRYPGPKPQTKEAGVVMLADAVEAASRTLADPTPSRIRTLIQTIVNNIFKDGQLDECELTLKDLHMITTSFSRTLQSIFHSRIDYPEVDPSTQIKGKGLDNGNSDIGPRENDRLRKSNESNGKNFKVQKIRG